jgi:hypothetical protein
MGPGRPSEARPRAYWRNGAGGERLNHLKGPSVLSATGRGQRDDALKKYPTSVKPASVDERSA